MIRAKLVFKFSDSKVATAVHDALLPDNIDLPEGMTIDQARRGRILLINLSLEQGERRIETIVSTLDEFVSHIQAALRSLQLSGTRN